MPAPSAPNAEVNAPAKLAVAFVARTVSSTVSVGARTRRADARAVVHGTSGSGRCSMRRRRAVAVLVGDRRRQRHQVGRRQCLLARSDRWSGAQPRAAGPASRCRSHPPSTVNTRSLLVAVRPSTHGPFSTTGSPLWPVAVSTSPDAPALNAQRISDRAGAVGAERRGERARKARRRVASPEPSRRPSASALAPGALMLGPSSRNTRFWPMFERRRRAVAVLVGDRRRQRHQVGRRQCLRLVRIVGRMHHRALLVQRHVAGAVHVNP